MVPFAGLAGEPTEADNVGAPKKRAGHKAPLLVQRGEDVLLLGRGRLPVCVHAYQRVC
jgi:hypothetical protein